MILSIIRRDAALRRLPMWGVLFLLNASVLLGLAVTVAVHHRTSVSATSLTVIGWITIAPFLLLAPGRSRCGALDLALPITARRLWSAHLALTALAGLLVTGSYVAMVDGVHRLFGESVPFRVNLSMLAMLLGAGTLLAVALLEAPRPSLARVPLSAGTGTWSILVLLFLLAVLPPLVPAGAPGALAALAVSLAVGAWAWRRVPPAFLLVPREPAAAAAAAPPAEAAPARPRDGVETGRSARRTVFLTTVRCVTAGAKELAGLPFIALFGLLLSSALPGDLRDFRFLLIPMAIYMLFSLVGPRLGSLHHADPLPIPRRLLFAGLILPSAAVFLTAYGVGTLAGSLFGPRAEMVDFQKQDEGWSLSAPLRVYRFAWDGRAPEIGSPWGESHSAESVAPVRGLRPRLFNPYSAPPGSSARFVALQASRAVEAVYGISIPPEEFEREYLETRPDGTVAGRSDSLGLRAGRPELSPRSGPVAAALFFLVGVPWMLLVALLLRAYRAGVGEWVRQTIMWGALGVLLAIWLVETLGLMGRRMEPWLIRALVEIPTFQIVESPVWTGALVILAALGFLGAYRLAEIQFARMEIPLNPSKYTLLQWASEKP